MMKRRTEVRAQKQSEGDVYFSTTCQTGAKDKGKKKKMGPQTYLSE
jgi:hypothetical protein